MEKNISDYLKELDSANSDQKKSEVRATIESMKEEADSAIRKHQREVSYDTKEFTVEMAVEKYHEGLKDDKNELFVPDYQRDFVWSKVNQSRLIESLMIGLPIPYVFIADVQSDDPDHDGRIEIVDGSQRIRTLHAFVKDKLVLEGLKLVPELNGFRFCDLTAARQRRFKRISIRIIELSDCTEDTRRDLFERINTGSDDLRDMEVRKGSKHGSSNLYQKVLAVCADDELFKKLAPLSDTRAKRGEALEFALRFFAYLDSYESFEHSVREFLDVFLGGNANVEAEKQKKMVEEFKSVMNFVERYFALGFKKTQGSKTTPRVRFEAIAVGVALALREKPNLTPKSVDDWLYTDDFKTLTTSDGSNSKVRVKNRIEFVRDKLLAEE